MRLFVLLFIATIITSSYTAAFTPTTITTHHHRSVFIISKQHLTSSPSASIPGPTTSSATPSIPSASSTTTSSSSTSSSSQQLRLSPNGDNNNAAVSDFREAEIYGLKLMQEGRYEEALRAFETGMTLDGTKRDIIRTKNVSGPSPVGGAQGGTTSIATSSLDEFELQAGHYNMACAHAKLGNVDESVGNLRKAWENGFDNVPTIKSDPDLRTLQETPQFNAFLNEIQPKGKGGLFNPFSLFGK